MSTHGPARILAILDLFTLQQPIWTGEEIAEAMAFSRPTAYRHIRLLTDAGLLGKARAGSYVLGQRIVQLDYQMRQSDPVLQASHQVMDKLAEATGLVVVLSSVSNDSFFDIHYSSRPNRPLPFTYARGWRRPWSQGAAPKVFLPLLPKAVQSRIYASFRDEFIEGAMGDSFEAFRAYLAPIRRANYYFSKSELCEGVDGAAVALRDAGGEPRASLALVGREGELNSLGPEALKGVLVSAALEIQTNLS